MGCLKCGKDTQSNHVFCPECLAIMEQHPVKPDAVVMIPQREPVQPERKSKRKKADPKKRSRRIRFVVRGLFGMVLILFLLVCILAAMLFSAQEELSALKETTEPTTVETTETVSRETTVPETTPETTVTATVATTEAVTP